MFVPRVLVSAFAICFKHEDVLEVEQNLVELESESDSESESECSDYELPDIETDFI